MRAKKRSVRRHHMERLKKKVVRYYDGWAQGTLYPHALGMRGKDGYRNRRVLGLLANTRQLCSEYCCGNPRKYFGECTRQEKVAPNIQDWHLEEEPAGL